MEPSGAATRASDDGAAQSTVVALFEDAIDAEHALVSLRKSNQAAERVSVLVLNRLDDRHAGDRAVDVARDIVAVALGAVANWLSGLAELIVSERGSYVVAGPMGAALTGIGRVQAGAASLPERAAFDLDGRADLSADSLVWVLTEFGFSQNEAVYVEHRLAAGDTLIAMTTAADDELETTRKVFGDHEAVYIGTAETDPNVVAAAGGVLAATPALVDGGDVVVVDVVARVRPAPEATELAARRGMPVACGDETEAGQVDRILIEDIDQTTSDAGGMMAAVPRYVIISFGGMLGLGRRRVAVPVQLVDLTTDPVAVQVDKATLHRAPAYDEDAPLSRRVEEQIFRYFDVTPYWLAADAGPMPTLTEGEGDDRDFERD